MKNVLMVFAALLFSLSMPLGAAAMSHDHDGHKEMKEHKSHEHGKEMDHGGMDMHGDMIMLGDDTEDGVKGMAHLKDVKASMEKMGMKQTHHFMVMFMDTASGKPIESGTVAVKITDPSGKTSEPVQLMGMQGHFGADISLPQKGEYKFTVGTKLPDEKKRQFEFEYVAK